MPMGESQDIVDRLRDSSLTERELREVAINEILRLRRCVDDLQSLVFKEEKPEPPPRKRRKAPKFPRGTPAKERLLAMIEIDKTTGCWIWLGSGSDKYGYMTDDNKKYVLAHRLSYSLHAGYEFKPREQAMHICDNTWCVNPEHIVPGTNQDNMEDKSRKGRHHGAKITFEQAKEIVRRYHEGETGRALGDEFGLTYMAINSIVLGRSWKGASADYAGAKNLKRRGERLSKLTHEDVREIRKKIAKGESQGAVASKYDIDRSTVSAIITGRRWRHVK